jgi:hypothetical protein
MNEMILAAVAALMLSGAAMAAEGDDTSSPKPPTVKEINSSTVRGIVPVPVSPVPLSVRAKSTVAGPQTNTLPVAHTAATKSRLHTAHNAGKEAHGTRAVHPIVATKKVPGTTPSKDARETAVVPASYSNPGDAMVKVWLNKSGAEPRYHSGEKMEINVSAAKDCNLMIFDFDGRGKLTQLFPNQFQQASSVKAGQTVAIGGDSSSFDYTASLPKGRQVSSERIFVYAYPLDESKNPPLSVAMNMTGTGTAFRSADISLDEYRKLVNQSKVFFARDVQITPKAGVTVAAADTTPAPNKYELGFVIEK